MVSAASYILAANFGKIDAAIYASAMLTERIEKIVQQRKAQGQPDILPTVADIEKTHLVFVNSHFRPHVAIAREYQKVRTGAGSPTLGGTTQFTINAFGDFYSDMVLRVRLDRVTAAALTSPAVVAGDGTTNSTSRTTATVPDGMYRALTGVTGLTPLQMGLHDGSTWATCTWVSKWNQTIGASTAYSNLVRYCENPADRLVDSTSFSISGADLDSYTYVASVMYNKFQVAPNKRRGYSKLIGQEVPVQGVSNALYRSALCTGQVDLTTATLNRDASTTSTSYQSNDTVAVSSNLTGFSGPAVSATYYGSLVASELSYGNGTVEQYDVCRQQKMVLNGPQTPRLVQPPLELWHKFQYWFNGDISQALTAANLPPSQRQLNVTFASAAEILHEECNLFLRVDRTALVASGATRPFPTVEYLPYMQYGGISTVTIAVCELYVNNLFVNEEVHDIYIKRVGFSLMRAHRLVSMTVSQPGTNSVLLQQLKWPVEYMFIGVQPKLNMITPTASAGIVATGDQWKYRDWHRMCGQVKAEFTEGYNSSADSAGSGPTFVSKLTITTDAGTATTIATIIATATGVAYTFPASSSSAASSGLSVSASGVVTGVTNAYYTLPLVAADGSVVAATIRAVTGGTFIGAGAITNGFGTGATVYANAVISGAGSLQFSSQTLVSARTARLNTLDKNVEYFLPVPTVDTLSLTAHGVVLYDAYSDKFYNQYIPLAFGAERINTPEEEGVYMITFAHLPGLQQPSDHLNTSRCRELYLDITTSYVSATTPCQLLIDARALNFLHVSDNSANIRYLT